MTHPFNPIPQGSFLTPTAVAKQTTFWQVDGTLVERARRETFTTCSTSTTRAMESAQQSEFKGLKWRRGSSDYGLSGLNLIGSTSLAVLYSYSVSVLT